MARKKSLSEDEQSKALDTAPAPDYVPNEREARGLATYKERRANRPASPRIKVKTKGGAASVTSDHPDEIAAATLQVAAMGLSDVREYNALLKDLINVTQVDGEANEGNINEMLSLVIGIGPANTTEAMLAVQMAAIHDAAMSAATRLRCSKTVDHTAHNAKILNNLTRTFAVQAETLKKLRGTGEQKVVVEHKHYHLAPGAIAPGSQAVLGNVTGGSAEELEGQSHERMRIPQCSPMLRVVEAHGLPVQSSGSEGQEGLQVPRGQGGGSGRAA